MSVVRDVMPRNSHVSEVRDWTYVRRYCCPAKLKRASFLYICTHNTLENIVVCKNGAFLCRLLLYRCYCVLVRDGFLWKYLYLSFLSTILTLLPYLVEKSSFSLCPAGCLAGYQWPHTSVRIMPGRSFCRSVQPADSANTMQFIYW